MDITRAYNLIILINQNVIFYRSGHGPMAGLVDLLRGKYGIIENFTATNLHEAEMLNEGMKDWARNRQ